jgi:hypothetical protein
VAGTFDPTPGCDAGVAGPIASLVNLLTPTSFVARSKKRVSQSSTWSRSATRISLRSTGRTGRSFWASSPENLERSAQARRADAGAFLADLFKNDAAQKSQFLRFLQK